MRIKNVNKSYLAVILLLAAILLLCVPFIRSAQGNPIIFGSEHYQHLNTHGFFIEFLSSFLSPTILSVSIPLILAISSLLIFMRLLLLHVKHQDELFYSLIILVLTPAFIKLHSGFHLYQFILFFGLLFALLYAEQSKWYYLPLGIMYLFDPLLGVLITLGVVFHTYLKREDKKETFITSLFLIGMFALTQFILHLNFGLQKVFFSVNELFSFFHAPYGLSLFLFILGLGGMFFERKRSLSLIIFAISLFYEPLRILVLPLLSYYAAITFYKLQTREWTINFIGNLTLVLFVCILIFGTSTFIKESIQEQPDKSHVDALFYLEQNGIDAKVLSSKDLSPFITFMTGKEVISNPRYFYTQNYNFIVREFQRQDIAYLLIDKDMKEGGVWQQEEEGLLFLLAYNDNFKKIYENNEVELYYFPLWKE